MRKLALVGIGLAVLLAGWRPAPREPEGLALVRALGVDGPGPVVLTAVCGGEDQEDPNRGVCTGESFQQALERVPWAGAEELSLTSVSYLIVGRDVDLPDVLLETLRNEELGAAWTVGLAAAGAAALLGACRDPASALELIGRRGVEAPTVVEALAALQTGEELCLPLITGGEDGPWLLDWEEWRVRLEQ